MARRLHLTSRVSVSHNVAFGAPFLRLSGVSVRVIADRIRAGETPPEVAADYHISIDDVLAAVHFEAGRRWADSQRADWNKSRAEWKEEDDG